jgi:hypothetical protein
MMQLTNWKIHFTPPLAVVRDHHPSIHLLEVLDSYKNYLRIISSRIWKDSVDFQQLRQILIANILTKEMVSIFNYIGKC